jgi:hypothetical protein
MHDLFPMLPDVSVGPLDEVFGGVIAELVPLAHDLSLDGSASDVPHNHVVGSGHLFGLSVNDIDRAFYQISVCLSATVA